MTGSEVRQRILLEFDPVEDCAATVSATTASGDAPAVVE